MIHNSNNYSSTYYNYTEFLPIGNISVQLIPIVGSLCSDGASKHPRLSEPRDNLLSSGYLMKLWLQISQIIMIIQWWDCLTFNLVKWQASSSICTVGSFFMQCRTSETSDTVSCIVSIFEPTLVLWGHHTSVQPPVLFLCWTYVWQGPVDLW